jgi:hypothetical protein
VHKSRLTQILIDCNESVMEQGVAFWSQALGLETEPSEDGDDRYVALAGKPGQVRVVLQSVPDESAYHLDLEADDVEAEVQRLEKLGAVRKYKKHSWVVMRAPTGHDFCVVRPQSKDFPDATANTWDD